MKFQDLAIGDKFKVTTFHSASTLNLQNAIAAHRKPKEQITENTVFVKATRNSCFTDTEHKTPLYVHPVLPVVQIEVDIISVK